MYNWAKWLPTFRQSHLTCGWLLLSTLDTAVYLAHFTIARRSRCKKIGHKSCTNLPRICSNPVDQTVFIEVRLMCECNTLEGRFWEPLDKVERSSFVVVPLLGNLQIQHEPHISTLSPAYRECCVHYYITLMITRAYQHCPSYSISHTGNWQNTSQYWNRSRLACDHPPQRFTLHTRTSQYTGSACCGMH